MRISTSNVDMYSGRTYSSVAYEEEAVTATTSKGTIPIINLIPKAAVGATETTVAKTEAVIEEMRVTKEAAEKEAAEKEAAEKEAAEKEAAERYKAAAKGTKISTAQQKKDIRQIRLQCIRYILDNLFSNRQRRQRGQQLRMPGYEQTTSQTVKGQSNYNSNNNSNSSKYSYGNTVIELGDFYGVVSSAGVEKTTVKTEKTLYYAEKERTSYSTTGSIVTADGQKIEFDLSFAMSRSFEKYYNEKYETSTVSFCDPLVINLDSTMPEVSDQKFLFDIDADGVMDTISQLSNKSGYLALDKNGDGEINDGSELFGTKSGNGFKDLAEYDSDGNGWIDEGDEIWNKLMIWCTDENGKTELFHVAEKGVGAICLQNTSTNFSLNSLKTNQTNAAVRNTGIFLYENGNVGTVQHLDLAR